MLHFLTEFGLGMGVFSFALLCWRHEMNIKAIREDFAIVKAELENQGILKPLSEVGHETNGRA